MYPKGLQQVEWFPELEQGEVLQSITTKAGRVRALGSFWAAELASSECRAVNVGETVKILGRKELTLLVAPIDYPIPAPTQRRAVSSAEILGRVLKRLTAASPICFAP